MTNSIEYASAVAPASETYQSGSEFDFSFLPSRGPSSKGSRSYVIPRTIHSGSSISSVSSSPRLTTDTILHPSMPSLRSERTSDRYDIAHGFTMTAGPYHPRKSSLAGLEGAMWCLVPLSAEIPARASPLIPEIRLLPEELRPT
jgi:hypothetical protein